MWWKELQFFCQLKRYKSFIRINSELEFFWSSFYTLHVGIKGSLRNFHVRMRILDCNIIGIASHFNSLLKYGSVVFMYKRKTKKTEHGTLEALLFSYSESLRRYH